MLDASFGCADPADTGEIFGLMTPFIYGTSGLSGVDMRLEPVFGEVGLRGRASLDLSFVPIALLPPAARFGWAVFGPFR